MTLKSDYYGDASDQAVRQIFQSQLTQHTGKDCLQKQSTGADLLTLKNQKMLSVMGNEDDRHII